MSASVLWPIGPHTLGKHLVLRSYLNAWLPIMGRYAGRIVFIDGFAGPGEYSGGEEGSPVIALNALCHHSARHKIAANVRYLFIEADGERAAHLESVVAKLRPELPSGCDAKVYPGACDETLNKLLDDLAATGQQLAPCFVMLDPFGISDIPMSTMGRLLQNRKAELYVTFMYEFINRFKETPEFESPLDSLFGTPEWRDAFGIETVTERRNFLLRLYEGQLRKVGARYVTRFDLYEQSRFKYAIFFATKSEVGLDRMKEAIWRIDRSGGYAFRGSHSNLGQLSLGLHEESRLEPLADEIIRRFSGAGGVTVDTIVSWAQTDATDYYSGQVKGVLKLLEISGRLEADPQTRKRRLTYPAGTRLMIAATG